MKNSLPKNDQSHTKEEMSIMIEKMQKLSDSFYSGAVEIGCHPFIEMTGFMNEYIKIARKAHEVGIDFANASTHTGTALPIEDYEAGYIAEKFNCIFGPSLLKNEMAARMFVLILFEGRYSLAKQNCSIR
jgi:hypothetical protein